MIRRQSDLYQEAISRFREDNGKASKRPSKCSAQKKCHPISIWKASNGSLCCGLNWIKKDMDVIRLCLMTDYDTPLRLRFTSSEARLITGLITDGLATFDRYLDPEYNDMMHNMTIERETR